jgi:hypothetical protein
MRDSGAKGNSGNTANIVGIKGQNTVAGGRPAPKISGGRRCLPYFEYESEDIKARGFLSNSFITGMTPTEMYFESEAAREGQLGTATGTAESGALSHKLFKVLEDCKVAYDGSIRNANNVIFQFSYLDGYEPGECVITSSPSTEPDTVTVRWRVKKTSRVYCGAGEGTVYFQIIKGPGTAGFIYHGDNLDFDSKTTDANGYVNFTDVPIPCTVAIKTGTSRKVSLIEIPADTP